MVPFTHLVSTPPTHSVPLLFHVLCSRLTLAADAVLQQLWADAPDASNTTSSSSGSSTTTDATTVTAIMPYSGCMRDLLAADPYLQLIGGDGAGGDCGGNSACVDSVEQGGAAVRISVRLSLQAIKARIDF